MHRFTFAPVNLDQVFEPSEFIVISTLTSEPVTPVVGLDDVTTSPVIGALPSRVVIFIA